MISPFKCTSRKKVRPSLLSNVQNCSPHSVSDLWSIYWSFLSSWQRNSFCIFLCPCFNQPLFFIFFYQEYLVSEIFFHSSVLRLFNTSEWCTSICEARPLSVMQVRSCLSKSSIKSDGAPKNRKSLRRAHTLARFGRTTSVLHCLAKRSQVAVQSLPNVQSVLTWQARPLRNARTVASGTTLPRSSILQS